MYFFSFHLHWRSNKHYTQGENLVVYRHSIHAKINSRTQSIFWSITFSLSIIEFRRKKVTGRQFGRMRKLCKAYTFSFFKKWSNNLGCVCWALSWRSRMLRIPDFGLFLSLCFFFNFLQHVIFVYMSGDWSAFRNSKLTYMTSHIKKISYLFF